MYIKTLQRCATWRNTLKAIYINDMFDIIILTQNSTSNATTNINNTDNDNILIHNNNDDNKNNNDNGKDDDDDNEYDSNNDSYENGKIMITITITTMISNVFWLYIKLCYISITICITSHVRDLQTCLRTPSPG